MGNIIDCLNYNKLDMIFTPKRKIVSTDNILTVSLHILGVIEWIPLIFFNSFFLKQVENVTIIKRNGGWGGGIF